MTVPCASHWGEEHQQRPKEKFIYYKAFEEECQ